MHLGKFYSKQSYDELSEFIVRGFEGYFFRLVK